MDVFLKSEIYILFSNYDKREQLNNDILNIISLKLNRISAWLGSQGTT